MSRSIEYMPRILKWEGGFVNHPADPGGATNRGVTIGTLRKLGIDKDGDGDSDLADLKALTEADAAKVFKRFYGDPVQADLLPPGLDYAMTDFAVNSGPTRAAQHLQRILSVPDDGHVGPNTLAAVAKRDTAELINALCDSRLRFLRGLKTWGTFGKGWAARVEDVRALALEDADEPVFADPGFTPKPVGNNSSPDPVTKGFWATLWTALAGIAKGR